MLKPNSFQNLIYISIIGLFFSCGLKYTPIETPIDKEKNRQDILKDKLKADFNNNGLNYLSYGFGQTSILKPPSYFKLDSLYQVKYENEKQGMIDKKLEEKIQIQKNILSNDTNQVYYILNHIYGVQDSSLFTIFHSDFYMDRQSKINMIEIRESAKIERKLATYYKAFKLKESFLYLNQDADEAELAFYEFYEEELTRLNGVEKDTFLNFMLNLMREANRAYSLDKTFLIKEMVRLNVQGQTRNYMDEKFEKMEEFYDENNKLNFYSIIYRYSIKKPDKLIEIKKVQVFLDPYLRLIEIKQVDN